MTKWSPSKITTRFSTSASHGYQRKIPRYKIILDTGKLKCNNNETYKTTTKQEQKQKMINKTIIKVLMEKTMKIIMAMITVLIKNIG